MSTISPPIASAFALLADFRTVVLFAKPPVPLLGPVVLVVEQTPECVTMVQRNESPLFVLSSECSRSNEAVISAALSIRKRLLEFLRACGHFCAPTSIAHQSSQVPSLHWHTTSPRLAQGWSRAWQLSLPPPAAPFLAWNRCISEEEGEEWSVLGVIRAGKRLARGALVRKQGEEGISEAQAWFERFEWEKVGDGSGCSGIDADIVVCNDWARVETGGDGEKGRVLPADAVPGHILDGAVQSITTDLRRILKTWPLLPPSPLSPPPPTPSTPHKPPTLPASSSLRSIDATLRRASAFLEEEEGDGSGEEGDESGEEGGLGEISTISMVSESDGERSVSDLHLEPLFVLPPRTPGGRGDDEMLRELTSDVEFTAERLEEIEAAKACVRAGETVGWDCSWADPILYSTVSGVHLSPEDARILRLEDRISKTKDRVKSLRDEWHPEVAASIQLKEAQARRKAANLKALQTKLRAEQSHWEQRTATLLQRAQLFDISSSDE